MRVPVSLLRRMAPVHTSEGPVPVNVLADRWRADGDGSLAHAAMLAAQGVIDADDLAAIQRGLAPAIWTSTRPFMATAQSAPM